jgi:ribonuclease HI
MKMYRVSCDGASKGNPGLAGIGVVIFNDKNEVVKKISEHIGVATNNEAEYHAVLRGICEAKEIGADVVIIQSDSKLVIHQMTGEYRSKAPNLWKIRSKILLEMEDIDVIFKHIPREQNELADMLAKQGAADEQRTRH